MVFTSRWGEPLYPDTVPTLTSRLISKYNEAAAGPAQVLPHARLHDLPHLHATTLLAAGVPVHVVAARLGHADPAVTLRICSHVLREHTLGVGDVFAQAVKASVKQTGLVEKGPSVCAGESGGQERDRTVDLRQGDSTRYTDRVHVRLVSGQSVAHAENLAHGFDAQVCP